MVTAFAAQEKSTIRIKQCNTIQKQDKDNNEEKIVKPKIMLKAISDSSSNDSSNGNSGSNNKSRAYCYCLSFSTC